MRAAPASVDADARRSDPRRVTVAAGVGATIEWYDFFLYGTAAGLVFDKLFFSALSGEAAQLAAFATFAAGFVARPVGGLLFGHLGDRLGRKRMLLVTLLLMSGGTAAIGLLPTYDQIGIWAPVLLVTLRVVQGIGVGGEYGGAVLLAVEHAPPERRGFLGSFAHVGVPAGLLLSAGAFAVASLRPDDAFLAWGWRACFLISVVLLAVGAWIRLTVRETPAFTRLEQDRELASAPLRDLLRAQPRTLLLGMGTRYVEGFTFNFYSVFLLAYVVTDLGLPRAWALQGVLLGAALGVVLVPLAGAASDLVGRRPVYAVGAGLALVSIVPTTMAVQSGSHAAIVLALATGLGPVNALVYGPLAAFWSELFDPRYRYTALNTLYQVSGLVASGLTPLLAAWLVARADGSLVYVAVYGAGVAALSLACSRALPETRGADLGEGIRRASAPARGSGPGRGSVRGPVSAPGWDQAVASGPVPDRERVPATAPDQALAREPAPERARA